MDVLTDTITDGIKEEICVTVPEYVETLKDRQDMPVVYEKITEQSGYGEDLAQMTSIAHVQALFVWMYQEARMWGTPVENAAANLQSAIGENLTKNFEGEELKLGEIQKLLDYVFGGGDTCKVNEKLPDNVKERFGENSRVDAETYCSSVKEVLTKIANQFDNSGASVKDKIVKAFDATKELSAVPDMLTAMQKNALDLMVNLVGRNC